MADEFDPRSLARRDLRRLVSELWDDERCDHVAPAVLDAAIDANAKSLDRAVLSAYLRHFPLEHPAFERLRAASALGAKRWEWPWKERGERWGLWYRDSGPAGVAKALLAGDDARAILRDIGLDGDLAEGEFVAQALETACEQVAATKADAAIASGERLIALFEQLGVTSTDAWLAWALLTPWRDRSPPDAYRERLTKLLVARVGDPRLSRARWDALVADMPGTASSELVDLMRRWLVHRDFRAFFSIVGAVTNDPKQWAAREEFWLGYLNSEVVDDACFAFGRQADALAEMSKSGGAALEYGEITGGGADPTHSALIISIGDVRIAEWSHNGSCRFWDRRDPQAPALYRKQYFGMQLRAMNGGKAYDGRFAAIPHMSGWQSQFAGFIYAMTGIRHPRWGEGTSRKRYG